MVAPQRRAFFRQFPRRGSAALIVLLGSLAGVACDKVALTAPDKTTITVFANATSVPLNGVIEVTANVIEAAGTPVQNGTQVTFTANMGSIDPREARTTDGKVTARFSAGSTSGIAKIGAFSGNAKATELEVKVGGAALKTITLSSTPTSVPTTGGTVEIVATLLDDNGNRVSGLPVSFSTTAGSLSISTTEADGNGQARTRLTTTRAATVTAAAGALSAKQDVTVVAVARLSLAASPGSLPSSGGTVEIAGVVFDADGNRLAGVPVSFSTTAGTLSVSQVTSDGNGEVRTRLTTTRTTTVTATAGGGGQATVSKDVTVNVDSAPTVSIAVSPTTVVSGQAATFTITVGAGTSRVRLLSVDFGDGQSIDVSSPAASTSISHVFREGGTYIVTATATDVNNESTVATTVLTVQSVGSLTVTLNLQDSAVVNTPVSMRVSVSGDSTPSRISYYEWDFGDGQTATVNSPAISHAYSSAGRKVVKVTVVTTDGGRATAQEEIVVTSS